MAMNFHNRRHYIGVGVGHCWYRLVLHRRFMTNVVAQLVEALVYGIRSREFESYLKMCFDIIYYYLILFVNSTNESNIQMTILVF